MNFVRSIIVPHTMARDTAQKTNSKNHFAAAGAALNPIAGRSIVDPGLNVGKNPLPPMTAKMPPAPKANPKPTAQYEIELTLRLVMTFATTVPTFFMRLNPTSSIAKPACMNITKHAATMTQTVSAATPAAEVAVVSSARTAIGTRAASNAIAAAMPNTCRRLMSAFRTSIAADKDATSVVFPPGRRAAAPLDGHSVGAPGRSQKRVDLTNWGA